MACMLSRRLLFVWWVCCIHLAGVYLFSSGFLLSRLSLPDVSTCPDAACSLAQTYNRAVVLIVDALRFDFVSPHPPNPPSPFHHNILTLPRELTAAHPRNSFLFNAYADPPTTTLQRIKGITTGSLPTFVDIGNSFGGSSIMEDSIMVQLEVAGRRAAFMGDDTWMSVFPDAFKPNMTFPFDSFNVEDLHTVDDGVTAHLLPLLADETKPFDFLVGHFLGVDHVGHRVGPDHPSMRAKLEQMNRVLTRVVEMLDDETLLVVLGDHGMDGSGDHGGDGDLETSSALWIYSKGPLLMQSSSPISPGLLKYKVFPGTTMPHRAVQQIDILPSLSLLLGLPIPFGNLGTVIPELFWHGDAGERLRSALEGNAKQIRTFLQAYRSSPSGAELDDAWPTLAAAWDAMNKDFLQGDSKLVALLDYNRAALTACRAMWAQFKPIEMCLGLALLVMGVLSSWSAYAGLSKAQDDWNNWLKTIVSRCMHWGAAGLAVALVAHFPLVIHFPELNALSCGLFGAAAASCVSVIMFHLPTLSLETLKSAPIVLILHALAFLSNSFTFWEDRLVPFLLVSLILPRVLVGVRAPTVRLRKRILGFSLLFAVCVRLMAISTVCREEQQPYCTVTYFATSARPWQPALALFFAFVAALGLPWAITRILHISRSDVGLAKFFPALVLRPALIAGTTYWFLEWFESETVLHTGKAAFLRLCRTWMARVSFGWILLAGGALWFLVPVCLEVQITEPKGKQKRQVAVIGFANAYGSPYLMFWTLSLALIYFTTQAVGQVVLALGTIALVAYLEVLDSVRDVQQLESQATLGNSSTLLSFTSDSSAGHMHPRSTALCFADILPMALLALHAFYGTGHQATVSSIQWKAAFILGPSVAYPASPITVVMNTLGPLFVFALGAPLITLWNRAPLRVSGGADGAAGDGGVGLGPGSDTQIKGETTLAALGIQLYYAVLLLGTAVSAAVLRRHLMVWKVFAPRYMAGALDLLVVDAAVMLGVVVGVEGVVKGVGHVLGVKT